MKKEYRELIEKVRLIDQDAAKYLESDDIKVTGLLFLESDDIMTVMDWSMTPQGSDFWRGIAAKLKEADDD